MPTLNKTTFYTKELLRWGGIICGCILLLVILFKIGRSIKEYFFPTPPPPPTVSFGQLPPISFPPPSIKEKLSYTTETVSGALPFFSDRATVYQITSPEPHLLNPDRAKEKVAQIGFVDDNRNVLPEKKLGPTTYQWQDQTSLQRILTMDIDSFNFTLTSQFESDDNVKNAFNLPTETNAVAFAQKYLDSMGLTASDIDDSKTLTTLLSLKDTTISPATSFSNTQLIRVDFFQKDVNGLPIVYPYPPYSLMSFLVAGGGEASGQIVEAKYIHRDVNSTSATYPIKTAAEAFKELQDGKAYIASYNGSGKNITIRNISLGYFVSDGVQYYLLPIVIFQGDDNFTAYISAITDNWIKK